MAEGLRFVQEALEHGAVEAVLVDEARQELVPQLSLQETPC